MNVEDYKRRLRELEVSLTRREALCGRLPRGVGNEHRT